MDIPISISWEPTVILEAENKVNLKIMIHRYPGKFKSKKNFKNVIKGPY